jgi:hypothetical protein
MRFSVTVSERTIIKWLRKLKRTRLQPRPFHPKRDEAAQEAAKEHFTAALKESCSAAPRQIKTLKQRIFRSSRSRLARRNWQA